MQPLVEVTNLRKVFSRTRADYGLKDVLLHSVSHLKKRLAGREFAALDDVSFLLYPGESLAILGRNGAGKSTLLSLLAGIIKPTGGMVKVRGRIGLMLELGSGFCHDLSGRENIMLNGLLLGATRRELAAAQEEIIEFSGVGDFIDEPLRSYSTGMQTRLGFAIAVHMRPDLLLIDEVLAVGDSEFRRKCGDRMNRMKERGVGTILVTHSLEDAEAFCERGIYLEHGRILFSGPVGEVAELIRTRRCEY